MTKLTKTDKQILALTAKGMREIQIAADMDMPIRAVRDNKHLLFQKLGAKNKDRALSTAKDWGII